MVTLRRRLLALFGVLAVGTGGAVLAGQAWQSRRSAAAEAEALARAAADTFEAALAPLLAREDAEGVRALVRGAGQTPLFRRVVVVGRRSGRILAAEPSLPEGLEPTRGPSCAGCHGRAGASPGVEWVAGEPGWVRVFRPLAGGKSCGACHREEGALGYLLLEVEAGRRPAPGRWVPAAAWAASFAGLLGLLHGALGRLVGRPLGRLREAMAALGGGEDPAPPRPGTPAELAEVHRAVCDEAARRAAARVATRERRDDLRALGGRAGGALSRVVGEAAREQDGAEEIHGRAGELDASVERARSSLDDIASSTSDNSATLTELSASVDEVARGADNLSAQVIATSEAVVEMVQSVMEVGDRVEVLAEETEETTSSMAQISASTRQIEQNAREAVRLSGRMGDAAQEGSAAVQETLEGIHASYGVIQETARAMGDLAEASQAIGGVVRIINEINDKTRLLALNAAIIAAQAGEHGKSFGVVAHEIKSLSDRTAASTGEIARLNRGIGQRMEAAALAVAKGQAATARSVALSESASQVLERILATARLANDMAQEILLSTEEQSRGSERVTVAMHRVSELVTHVRRAAREHRATGERVNRGADVMRTLTEQVKSATAEQAEVSRYLSEAIAAVDQNLKGLLHALEGQREHAGGLLEQAARLRDAGRARAEGFRALGEVVEDLRSRLGEEAG